MVDRLLTSPFPLLDGKVGCGEGRRQLGAKEREWWLDDWLLQLIAVGYM